MRQGQQGKRMRGRGRKGGGNPANRSYESNGPDVKVRGTAAHIADKYQQLARDAASAGDPVASENYLQHAEHYVRILGAAQAASAPQQQPRKEEAEAAADAPRELELEGAEDGARGLAVMGEEGADASEIVDTPESSAPSRRAPRRKASENTDGEEAPRRRRRTTRRSSPRSEAGSDDAAAAGKSDSGSGLEEMGGATG